VIELVCFDMGRVLIRICNNWREACGVAGITIPHDRPYVDDAAAEPDREACRLLDTGRINEQEFARRVAVTRGITPQQVLRAYDVFIREPFPGAVELLDELRSAGMATACLSNSSDGHWRQICDPADPCFFPLDRFTWRFASHLIGVCKPDDAIFEHVERTTGRRPESIAFFDDLETNVAAAARRGWRAHQIRLDQDPIAQARAQLRSIGVSLSPEKLVSDG
jgi:FMN phosphatase YigB (HAD superfamily)